MDQWDRFADSAGRTLDGLGWDQNVDVFVPTETYSSGDGFEVTYPDSPTATVDGALDTPDADADVDRGGTTETADLLVYVRTDTGVTWTGAGENGDAETGIMVDGLQYVIETIEPQHDGLLALECTEVDSWP
jgi:hypothetical protein